MTFADNSAEVREASTQLDPPVSLTRCSSFSARVSEVIDLFHHLRGSGGCEAQVEEHHTDRPHADRPHIYPPEQVPESKSG